MSETSDSVAQPKERTEPEHKDYPAQSHAVGNDQKASNDYAGAGDSAAEVNEGPDGQDGNRQHHRGQRGGSFSYRRGGRGQYRRGRGGRGGYTNLRNQQEESDEAAGEGAVGQWNGGAERERGKGGEKRFSRGRGGRQRTKSEKSSLLDGKRDPLPDHGQNLDDVDDFWDVTVSGYAADMTEDDLWETFGERDVAAIIQQYTHDMKPYCHIYTTTKEMTNELLRCNRDMFRGNMLYVAMSEDIIARGVSQMLKKKPMKPKFKKPNKHGASGDEQAEQQQQDEQSPKEETNDEGLEC